MTDVSDYRRQEEALDVADKSLGPVRRLFRWVNFAVLLPRPRLLGLAAAVLRFYQVSGLRSLARATGLLKLLPSPLADWEPLLPSLPPARERAPPRERVAAVVQPREGAAPTVDSAAVVARVLLPSSARCLAIAISGTIPEPPPTRDTVPSACGFQTKYPPTGPRSSITSPLRSSSVR